MSERQNVLIVGVDRYGRTWCVRDWEKQFVVYYILEGKYHTLYNSQDQFADPPRVLLGRAERAEQKVRELERELAELKAHVIV